MMDYIKFSQLNMFLSQEKLRYYIFPYSFFFFLISSRLYFMEVGKELWLKVMVFLSALSLRNSQWVFSSRNSIDHNPWMRKYCNFCSMHDFLK